MNDEILQLQHAHLKMMQAHYPTTPILIKIVEGGYPKDEQGKYMDAGDGKLYRWLPFTEVWGLAEQHGKPIFTRGIMQNEFIIDADTDDWNIIYEDGNRIIAYLIDNSIPHDVAWSGGKGVHIDIFFDGAINENVINAATHCYIDIARIARNAVCKWVLAGAQVDPNRLCVDWGKINFSTKSNGSQIREYGTLRSNGNGKTLIHTIPKERPTKADIRAPTSMKVWGVPDALCKIIEFDVLKAINTHLKYADAPETVCKIDKLSDVPCMATIINMKGTEHQRYEMAKQIVWLCEGLSISKKDIHRAITTFINNCKWETYDKERYVDNAMATLHHGYRYSCTEIRRIAGDGVCNRTWCPVHMARNGF